MLSRFLWHEATIGIFLLPLALHLYIWVDRSTVRVFSTLPKHATLSYPAKSRIRTARSEVERTNNRHLKQQTSPAGRRQPETWDFFRDVTAHVGTRCDPKLPWSWERENVRTWRFTSRRKRDSLIGACRVSRVNCRGSENWTFIVF